MGLIVGVPRVLLLCAALLVLPALVAAQTPEYYGAVAYDIEHRVFAAASGVGAAAALAAAEHV